MKSAKKLVTTASVLVGVLSLGACGSASAAGDKASSAATSAASSASSSASSSAPETSSSSASETSSSSAPETSSNSASETSSASTDPTASRVTKPPVTTAGAPAGGVKTPEWARPVTTEGTKVGEVVAKTYKVDIYQVATDAASKDGMLVDPNTKESLLKKGDPIVYFNFVFTNTSTEPMPLGASMINVKLKFADWKYMSGLPGDSSSDQYKKHGLYSSAMKLGAKAPYLLLPGESANYADNIAYTAGKEVEVEARMTPVDETGEKLVHDKKVVAEGKFTMK